MISAPLRRGLLSLSLALPLAASIAPAQAGWPRHKGRAPVALTPTAYARPYSRPPIGTFVPEPYIYVRGNGSVGGGYSPMGQYGPENLALQGPLSPLRSMAAPVVVYDRGYDGVARPTLGTSFSNPNMPRLSPVVYPTRANDAYGFRRATTPPWWDSGITWIDQN